jgi:hypothetical protein
MLVGGDNTQAAHLVTESALGAQLTGAGISLDTQLLREGRSMENRNRHPGEMETDRWLTPVILATWEADIGRTEV